MKIFLNNFDESGSKITKNQVSKILNKVLEEAGFKKENFDNIFKTILEYIFKLKKGRLCNNKLPTQR